MIRTATQEDLPKISELFVEYLAETPYHPFKRNMQKAISAIKSDLDNETCTIYLDYRGEKLIGILWGGYTYHWSSSDKLAQDKLIFVRKGHRGFGSAIRLIREFEDWAKDQECDHIILGSIGGVGENIPAQKTYERIGYKELGGEHLKRL